MDIALYEPLYRQGQILSDPDLLPFVLPDNDRAAWRELRILVDIHAEGLHRGARKTGLLSPKFALKSGLPIAAFAAFARQHPETDICILNPFPQLAYFSYNVWMQGEIAHPGLVSRTRALLAAAGVGLPVDLERRHPADRLCYSNFWVGTPDFWDDYVGGVLRPIARLLLSEPGHPAVRDVLEDTVHTDPSPFLPFVVERLLTTFLIERPDLSVASVPMDPSSACINPFEEEGLRFLRPRVDAAPAQGPFSADLVETMEHLCRLRQLYFFAYYADRPHPHSGGPIRPDQNGV
ncbi:hypothetical protein [Aurantimonas sp. Leaf443]|uniref:hypothetical protein n=1 Tax=Aurantimonas sp. Leaf443 TaxID=1736378 RepID=UPI0007023C0C|nr:hypothetical protein [Aurantimonas sp. Leaf443]KQT85139.1 hypothetical protein ASG48_07625 [Aurantimonas sp. Leaf443]